VYDSNESGRPEVYVQTFPPGGGKWQISTGGGTIPVWSRDGKEIYYLAPDNFLMAVRVESEPEFRAHPPTRLFQTPPQLGAASARHYDPSPDGRKFIVAGAEPAATAESIVVVVNWEAELKAGK
jgi:hypothetical protein